MNTYFWAFIVSLILLFGVFAYIGYNLDTPMRYGLYGVLGVALLGGVVGWLASVVLK